MSLRPTLKQSRLPLPQKRKSARKHCLVKLPKLEKQNGFLNIQVPGMQASSRRLLSQRVLWMMMMFLTEADKLMETLSGRRIRYVLICLVPCNPNANCWTQNNNKGSESGDEVDPEEVQAMIKKESKEARKPKLSHLKSLSGTRQADISNDMSQKKRKHK